MATSSPRVNYHILQAGSPPSAIQPVLDLNNTIFGVDASATHHNSLTEWQKRLDDPASIIAYATLSAAAAAAAETVDESALVGFIFAHPKTHAGESTPVLHIWLAGVLPASRGTGMFHGLMDRVEEQARRKGVKTLSVATFPARFEKMYAILNKTGWSGEKDAGGGKVVLTKDLS